MNTDRLKTLLFGLFLTVFFNPVQAFAGICSGKWVNPITDVCWSCIFPITIGSVTVFNGDLPDTSNPSLPVCICPGTPVPRVGLTIGFWEPIAVTDVTRHPFCLVNMGGLQLSMGANYGTGKAEFADPDQNSSFYYVHWYVYPLLYWLRIITDGLCVEIGEFDIAYLTELDPTWHDDELTFILNPEAILFGNLIAQAACAADSFASSAGLPLDTLFWCAGSHGGMYPLNGTVQEHLGGVQSSTLLTERMAYKMHREFLLWSSTGSNSPAICSKYPTPIIPKSRYRYQMVNPVPTTGRGGCFPFGRTTTIWGVGHEYPYAGEDFGYLVWRKANCCAF